MLLTDADAVESVDELDDGPQRGSVAVAISAGLKALFAAASGLLLTCGLAVVVWAITPSSGSGPVPLLRAGVTAFGAANGMTVRIGRSALTLPPLMLALVAIALLTTVVGRGRTMARDRHQELIAGTTAVVVYAVAVVGTGVGLGAHGALRADQWWRPALLAAVVIGATTVGRGTGWRPYLTDRLPAWTAVAVRLGAVGVATLVGGGAVTLLIGLVRSFGDASTVQTLAAPGAAGGFGMALLGLAYLPNAIIAGVGYSTGVGFSIGGGSYSPFGSSPVELPAVSLLTAAPDGHTVARPTLLLLLFPVLAALLIGRGAVSRLDLRSDRLFAVGGAAVFAAVALAVMAQCASGGVTGGEWSSSGVPPALLGLVVAVGLGAIGAAVAGVARVSVSATADQIDDVGDEVVSHNPAPQPDAVTPPADAVTPPADAKDADPLDPDGPGAQLLDSDLPEGEREELDTSVVHASAGDARDVALLAGPEGDGETDETGTGGSEPAAGHDATEIEESGRADASEPGESVDEVGGSGVDSGEPSGGPPGLPTGREEDLLADADAETDADLIAGLSRPTAPRQAG